MSVDDFRINAYVRQVLARSWVDMGEVRYGVVSRIVYFQGCFKKQRPVEPPTRKFWQRARPEETAEDLALLERVEKEILLEPAVTGVVFRLDNFRKDQGKWEVA